MGFDCSEKSALPSLIDHIRDMLDGIESTMIGRPIRHELIYLAPQGDSERPRKHDDTDHETLARWSRTASQRCQANMSISCQGAKRVRAGPRLTDRGDGGLLGGCGRVRKKSARAS
jgi:hypothetical protein